MNFKASCHAHMLDRISILELQVVWQFNKIVNFFQTLCNNLRVIK